MVSAVKSKPRTTKEIPMAKPTAKTAEKKSGRDTDGSRFEGNPQLRNTLAQIEKQFGEGAIMPLGSEHATRIEGISTGSLSLDLAERFAKALGVSLSELIATAEREVR